MPSDKIGSFSEFSSWASKQTELGSSPDDALAFRDKGKIPGRVFGTWWRRSVSRLLYVDRGKVREKLGVAQKEYEAGSLPRNANLHERRDRADWWLYSRTTTS